MNNSTIPKHIGLILDGNRRWARENGLPQLEGHRAGYENLKTIADIAFDSGVEYLSAYIFSTENWNRSKEEVAYLMNLLPIVFSKYLKDFIKKGIRIRWLGTYDKLSQREIDLIENALEKTKDLSRGNLCFCFNYGGWTELQDAVRQIVAADIDVEDISIDTIRQNIYDPKVPDVDLIIRTSGEQRLSNFMLWRAAYSELYFTDKYWPAFTGEDLQDALKEFENRQRRFGT